MCRLSSRDLINGSARKPSAGFIRMADEEAHKGVLLDCHMRDTCVYLPTDTNIAGAYCALFTIFPQVISGLRKPIAIQAAISFNINLPE